MNHTLKDHVYKSIDNRTQNVTEESARAKLDILELHVRRPAEGRDTVIGVSLEKRPIHVKDARDIGVLIAAGSLVRTGRRAAG